MSGRVVTLDASIHRAVQVLLPWFAAGTLGSEERTMVQAHLDVCTQCKADVDWQCKLQVVEPGNIATLDVERAWSRLLPQLDDVHPVRPVRRRRTLFELAGQHWPSNPSWMQWALAAQMVLIVGLTSIAIPQYDGRAAYHTLGESGSATGNFVVVFKPSTTEQDLRRILETSGARITDGPTATGAYLLKVSNTRLTSTLSTLHSEPAVVLAESLDSGRSP